MSLGFKTVSEYFGAEHFLVFQMIKETVAAGSSPENIVGVVQTVVRPFFV